MGLTHVTVSLKPMGTSGVPYESVFLVNTGAIDTMAPASDLRRVGITPAGATTYEFADGTFHEFSFGLAQIEFMGEVTAGRVIFGPDGAEPILGITALESVGISSKPRAGIPLK
jgi:predicted aspartyl protease